MIKMLPSFTQNTNRFTLQILLLIFTAQLLFGKSDFITYYVNPQDIAQNDSSIWIACYGGVMKLDKNTEELTQFNAANSGFSDYVFNSLAVDKSGKIWVSSNGKAVLSFDGKHWQHYTEKNTIFEQNLISKLYAADDGSVWCLNIEPGAYTQFCRFNGQKWENIFKTSIHDGYETVNNFFAEGKDLFWFTDGPFLRKVNRGVVTTFSSYNSDMFPGKINALARDKQNRRWMGFNSGLVVNDWNEWYKYTTENSLFLSNKITSIDCDKVGRMWLGSDKGVSMYDGENWFNYQIPQFDLEYNPITKILADGEQFWVYSENNPIYKYDGNSWIELPETNSMISYGVIPTRIAEDIDSTLWVVFSADHIVRFNSKKQILSDFTIHSKLKIPNSASILQFKIDDAGTKWFATSEGLIKYDNKSWELFDTTNTSLNSQFISSFDFDRNGNIWVCTGNEFAEFDGSDFYVYDSSAIGFKAKGEFVCIDKNNVKWFLCDSLIVRYDDSEWEKFNFRDLGMTLEPRKMYVDSNNVKYFLWYVGYSIFDDISWNNIRTENTEPGATISYGGVDKKNNFWLASWAKIFKKSGANYKEYNEFNSPYCQNTIYSFDIGRSGKKYIGSENFIAIIDDNEEEVENYIRADRLNYLVYNPKTTNNDKEITPGAYFELLAGYKDFGRARPVVLFKNMTADKELQFYAGIEIFGKYSGSFIYKKDVLIDSSALANFETSNIYLCDSAGTRIDFPVGQYQNGVPPGGYVKVIFDDLSILSDYKGETKLELNVFSKNQSYPENEKFPLEDISDDKLTSDLNIVTKTFMDGGFVKSKTVKGKSVPDTKWWITKGVESVNAEQNTWFPHNSVTTSHDSAGNYVPAPPNQFVYRMNRVDENNKEYNASGEGGDELISHIMDFRKRAGTVFHIGLQRTGKDITNFNTDWAGSKLAMGMLYGPEHRVVSIQGSDTAEVREPDKIRFDFIAADAAHLEKLLNPKEEDWTTYYYHKMKDTSKGTSAFTLFGGGGSSSILINPYYDSIVTEKQGTINDIYDTGKDFEFKNYFVHLPYYFFGDSIYTRFRIKVEAKDDGLNNAIIDDKDDFYIETIDMIPPTEGIDLSLNSAKVFQKYASYPLNENISLPVKTSVQNLTYMNAPGMLLYVKINPESETIFDNDLNKYRKYIELPFMRPIQNIISDLPAFKPYEIESIRSQLKPGINKFKMQAYIDTPGGDIWTDNDTLYSEFSIYLDTCLSYDIPGTGNPLHVLSGIQTSALNLPGFSIGDDYWGNYNNYLNNTISGQLAVKFSLDYSDTVFALQTNWNPLSSSMDDIVISIYKDTNGLPGERIAESVTFDLKCRDGYTKEFKAGEWVYNVFKKPVILEAGKYWASVAQLGESGLQLDASLHRMGMLTTVIDSANGGANSKTLLIDENLKENMLKTGYPNIPMRNDCIAAYENTYGSGSWVPFTPESGNPAYPFRDMYGTIYNGTDSIRTYTRGTVIPKIRISFDGSHYIPDAVEESVIANGGIYINPNPANDFIEISYSPLEKGVRGLSEDVRIYNIFGQEVYPTPALPKGRGFGSPPLEEDLGGVLRIDVSGFTPSVYFVRVGEKVGKFVKY